MTTFATPPPPTPTASLESPEHRQQARDRAAGTQLVSGLRALLGRRRPGPDVIINLLVAENHGLHLGDGVAQTTPGENVLLGRCPAQAEIARGTRRLRRRAWWRDRRASRVNSALLRHRQLLSRPMGRAGAGLLDADQVRTEIAMLYGDLRAEADAGSTEHDRVPWGLRLVPWFIATFDFMLLLYFMTVVLNLAPGQEMSTKGLTALLFALLGGAVVLSWLTLLGDRLRSLREYNGEIGWARSGWTTRAMLAIGLVVIAALGVLMFVRVQQEVNEAFSSTTPLDVGIPLLPPTGSPDASPDTESAAATPVAAVFAVLSIAGNLVVIAVHALDGSTRQRRLTRLSRLAHRRHRRLERAERRIERRRSRLDRQARSNRRLAALSLAGAQTHLQEATAQVNAGRAVTRRPALPVPRAEPELVDLTALEVMMTDSCE